MVPSPLGLTLKSIRNATLSPDRGYSSEKEDYSPSSLKYSKQVKIGHIDSNIFKSVQK